MKPNVTSILKLYFDGNKFLEEEKAHDADQAAEGKAVGDWDDEKHDSRAKRINEKRERLLNYLLVVIILFLLGAITADVVKIFINVEDAAAKFVRVASLIIVAWAVLSKLDDT